MKQLTNCPYCGSDFSIKEVECTHCHTQIRGNFKTSKFNAFSPDQLYFIEIFLKNEGNIKLMEKDLGISYPTVKNRLQQINEVLGHKATQAPKQESVNRIEVLKKLSDGEINLEDALDKLGGLK